MYKILIVDDEDIIRVGLSTTVSWEKWGYEVVGAAKDGVAAIELLEKTPHVDVLLTDVKMPKMDGLKLASIIHEKYPKMKVVILSGYNEPVYLQEAIKNHVVLYLSKPTDYEEFEREFKKLKKTLDAEKKEEEAQEKLRGYLNESLPHMREVLLFDLLNGSMSDLKGIEEKLEFYNINIPKKDFAVLFITIDNRYKLLREISHEELYLRFRAVSYLASNIFGGSPFFYDNGLNAVAGICPYENLNENIIRLQREFFSLKASTISVSVSRCAKAVQEIPGRWDEAIQASRQKEFFGNEAIVFYDDISDFQPFSSLDVGREINKIIDIILSKGGADAEISKLFARLEGELVKDGEFIDKVCLEILFALERAVGGSGITLSGFLSARSESIFDVFKYSGLTEKSTWLLDVIIGFTNSAANERNQKMSIIAHEAIAYIEENYTNNGMSLDALAGVLRKNPAYLSNLFKKETGQNFSEYVRTLRMEKSKDLLKNVNLRIYEIAEMVGYADVSNFTKVFRQYAGVSPGEYRNAVLKSSQFAD